MKTVLVVMASFALLVGLSLTAVGGGAHARTVDPALYAGPTVTASAGNGCFASTNMTNTVALSVTSGDLIYVVSWVNVIGNVSTVHDGINTFALLHSFKPIGGNAYLDAWTATATSTITDNIASGVSNSDSTLIAFDIHGSSGVIAAASASQSHPTNGVTSTLTTATTTPNNTLTIMTVGIFGTATFTPSTGTGVGTYCSQDLSLGGLYDETAGGGPVSDTMGWTPTDGFGALLDAFSKPSGPAPAAPTSLLGFPIADNSIGLTWTNPVGVLTDNHVVEYSAGCAALLFTFDESAVVTSASVGTLTPNTGYCFTVTATNANGTSIPATPYVNTSTFQAPPSAPTALTASAISSSSITLTWTLHGAYPLVNVTVEFGITSALGTNVSVGNVTGYTLTGLADNMTFYFAVESWTSGGNSSLSTQASNTTLVASSGGSGAPLATFDLTLVAPLFLLVVLAVGIMAVVAAARRHD